MKKYEQPLLSLIEIQEEDVLAVSADMFIEYESGWFDED
jgi:hypothetical protein